jgi:hypothetical protein
MMAVVILDSRILNEVSEKREELTVREEKMPRVAVPILSADDRGSALGQSHPRLGVDWR